MKTIVSTFIIMLLFAPIGTRAQSNGEQWEYYYSMIADEEETEADDADNAYDLLEQLAANKININNASRDDFDRLFFLTRQQIEDVEEYVDRYGPVRSMAELEMVKSLDLTRCRLLACLMYCGERPTKKTFPPIDTLLRRGKNELAAALKVPLYEREGDKNGYLGPRYKHWLRYKFSYGRTLEAGLTASQDAGEPFFAGRNKWGYDYYSLYFALRNVGRLKTVVAGRYRARMGLGLVMNTDYSFGKTSTLGSLTRTATSLRPHSSRSEANYLQGAAATVALGRKVDVTAFVSHRLTDATLNADSTTVRTIVGTGLHRTTSEMERRHNTRQTAAGAALGLNFGALKASLQGVFATYNRSLQPDSNSVYRRFYPRGRTFANLSLAYSYTHARFSFAGETAIDDGGALATLHALSAEPWQQLTFMLVHRFYSYRYHSIFASAFSDGGRVSNEHGAYLGINWRASGHLSLAAYTDYSRAAWPRYMISLPSHSWDNQLQATLAYPTFSFTARYRLRLRQRDNADHTALLARREQRLRLSATTTHGIWYATTTLQGTIYTCQTTSRGWMIGQSGGVKAGVLSIDANAAYFNTDSYDSRLYAYERGLLYNFSIPMLSGEGIRYAIRLRADINRSLMLMAKCGVSNYFDRTSIGTGLQLIAHSSQTDVEMQLRWKF